MKTEQRGGAAVKARMLTLMLMGAGEAGVNCTAVAVLAHLIADAWFVHDDESWSATTSRQTIASRLGVSLDTVKRAVRDLVSAGLIDRREGRGRVTSCYVLVAPATQTRGCMVAPSEGAMVQGRGCKVAPSEGARRGGMDAPLPVLTVKTPPPPPAGGGGVSWDGVFEAAKRRPNWLGETSTWMCYALGEGGESSVKSEETATITQGELHELERVARLLAVSHEQICSVIERCCLRPTAKPAQSTETL